MIQLAPIVLSAFSLAFAHPAPVTCQMRGFDPSIAGATTYDQIWVRPWVCRDLNQLARHGSPFESELGETAAAIVVLAHEYNHVEHPNASETKVQAYALRSIPMLVSAIVPRRYGMGGVTYRRRATARIYQFACASNVDTAERYPRLTGCPPEWYGG